MQSSDPKKNQGQKKSKFLDIKLQSDDPALLKYSDKELWKKENIDKFYSLSASDYQYIFDPADPLTLVIIEPMQSMLKKYGFLNYIIVSDIEKLKDHFAKQQDKLKKYKLKIEAIIKVDQAEQLLKQKQADWKDYYIIMPTKFKSIKLPKFLKAFYFKHKKNEQQEIEQIQKIVYQPRFYHFSTDSTTTNLPQILVRHRNAILKDMMILMTSQKTNRRALIQQLYVFAKQSGYEKLTIFQTYKKNNYKKLHMRDVMKEYTSEGGFYRLINDILRGFNKPTQLFYIQPLFCDLFKAIREMRHQQILRQDMIKFTCFRGTQMSQEELNEIKINKSYVNYFFMSTSKDQVTAIKFCKNVLLKIIVDLAAGQNFDPHQGFCDLSKLSQYSGQKQVLFNPLSRFCYIGEQIEEDYKVITLKYQVVLKHLYIESQKQQLVKKKINEELTFYPTYQKNKCFPKAVKDVFKQDIKKFQQRLQKQPSLEQSNQEKDIFSHYYFKYIYLKQKKNQQKLSKGGNAQQDQTALTFYKSFLLYLEPLEVKVSFVEHLLFLLLAHSYNSKFEKSIQHCTYTLLKVLQKGEGTQFKKRRREVWNNYLKSFQNQMQYQEKQKCKGNKALRKKNSIKFIINLVSSTSFAGYEEALFELQILSKLQQIAGKYKNEELLNMVLRLKFLKTSLHGFKCGIKNSRTKNKKQKGFRQFCKFWQLYQLTNPNISQQQKQSFEQVEKYIKNQYKAKSQTTQQLVQQVIISIMKKEQKQLDKKSNQQEKKTLKKQNRSHKLDKNEDQSSDQADNNELNQLGIQNNVSINYQGQRLVIFFDKSDIVQWINQ